ncbi:unnamed protein product [Leptidea sinapis]|uniref:Dystroglycan 1 n=1 Tax=Leptidea sinapis TaxID=189913 RepID=A0A5E4Q8F5_9NEOP|nr:unnamed protein product [Leptidea sinapis]
MGQVRCVACAVLLLCQAVLGRHDDDFAFDNNDEFQLELTANHSEITKNGLKRLWGVPDTSAYVGHLFRMEIPKEAFTGEVSAYKVRSDNGRRLPSWLAVDTKHGLISGLPQRQDLGAHTFTVTAHGRAHGLTATDVFTIEVKKSEEKPQSKYGACVHNENRLVLVILLDASFHKIAPRQRIRALMELANFMALDGDEFWMEPYKGESAQAQAVLLSGPGTTKRRHSEATTAIYLNVGCGDKLWSRHKVLVAGLREQSRDGTLYHLLKQPILGWRLVAVKPTSRPKRQSPMDDGSGDYENYDGEEDPADYSGYGDDEDDEYDSPLDIGPVPDIVGVTSNPSHPHRHHHGQPDFAPQTTDTFQTEPDQPSKTPPSTPQPDTPQPQTPQPQTPVTSPVPPIQFETQPILPHTYNTSPATEDYEIESTHTTEDHKVKITPYLGSASESTNINITKPLPTNRNLDHSPVVIVPEDVTTSTEPELESISPSERSSTIIGRTTETVTFAMPVNQPPTLKHHMKKLAITAGKAFRYIIPADLFTDPEDGSNLTFTMYEAENVPLSNNSWIQFMPAEREVYGLPLEAHVSRWNFVVEAQDSEGQIARGPLDITVQQHKSGRTFNHMFVMQFKLNRRYSNAIDWQIRALEGIVNLFRDTDMDHLTVLNATISGDLGEFDTFFDPEDGGTRNLHLSLRFSDRSEIPATHWLQFDSNNQEFYGLPDTGDEGSVHYQLIAEDSSKKSAYDSLIVEVAKAPTIRPTVEFQMTMDPSPGVVHTATNKRRIVEKLAALFDQRETDNIRIQSINDNPPTIIWCPKREIEELRNMIISDERGSSAGNLREKVDQVFDKDLKYSDYLLTFVIPAVVIVCMILLAGKMSVGDEEERQAFRSKGIPVIFQDELEERTDTEPVDKSPVIMREEKPPLLPPAPDYRNGEDAPYRPPPPFAASRTPPRPKATPTYRKPPPYVPP